MTYVDHLKNAPHFPIREDISRLAGQILKITVAETSQLELDPNIMHPFVKMHFVNMNTGQYITKRMIKPVLNLEEKITRVDAGQNHMTEEATFIPPFATNCCDLRVGGNARAKFNESMHIIKSS